jgi:hypothetical protein
MATVNRFHFDEFVVVGRVIGTVLLDGPSRAVETRQAAV